MPGVSPAIIFVKDTTKQQPAQVELSKSGPERSDKRLHVALPVRITYWDQDKKPGLEMACTYDISPHGARISSLRCVKETGEIIAIERGRNKSFCRVVWIGDANSELRGQIGLQCVESERTMFEGELRDMSDVYDTILRDSTPRRGNVVGDKGNRRILERLPVSGVAELLKEGRNGPQKVTPERPLGDGLPGYHQAGAAAGHGSEASAARRQLCGELERASEALGARSGDWH